MCVCVRGRVSVDRGSVGIHNILADLFMMTDTKYHAEKKRASLASFRSANNSLYLLCMCI